MPVNDMPSRPLRSVQDWTFIVRSEYGESPGLALTIPQVQRLWNLDSDTCAAVLDALVRARYLRRTQTGMFVRAINGC
jgi:hypothetical protein